MISRFQHVFADRSQLPTDYRVRPMVEGLEERALFSVAPVAAAALAHHNGGGIVQSLKHHHHPQQQQQQSSVLPLKITNIVNQNGQLVALGKIGVNPFTAPITLTTTAAQTKQATSTPILHLQLGPIHLDLLGLNVDTSKICLDITATSGPGNLLGNLLTNVSNLLNGGTSLGNILGGLTGTQTNQLLGGLTGLLNGVLGNLLGHGALHTGTGMGGTGGTGGMTNGTCNILNLSVGPLTLNLLGLNVKADNCANGPITVDVTAQTGQGNLLGNRLCGVADSLGGSLNQLATELAVGRLLTDILNLV